MKPESDDQHPEFRAAQIGKRNEAGGCYACVIPCGAFALTAMVAAGGFIYFGVHYLWVLVHP
jgi:hypothetical protein